MTLGDFDPAEIAAHAKFPIKFEDVPLPTFRRNTQNHALFYNAQTVKEICKPLLDAQSGLLAPDFIYDGDDQLTRDGVSPLAICQCL